MKSGRSRTPSSGAPRAAKPKLLSGGNPQIPKGEGDAPVQGELAMLAESQGALGAAASRSSSPADTVKLTGAQKMMDVEIEMARRSNVNV